MTEPNADPNRAFVRSLRRLILRASCANLMLHGQHTTDYFWLGYSLATNISLTVQQ